MFPEKVVAAGHYDRFHVGIVSVFSDISFLYVVFLFVLISSVV